MTQVQSPNQGFDESQARNTQKPYFNKDESWLSVTFASFVNKVIDLGNLTQDVKEKDLFLQSPDFSAEQNLKDFYDVVVATLRKQAEEHPATKTSLARLQYEYVKSYWNLGAFLWFLCQVLQIAVPLIIQDYVDWLREDRNNRPVYKPWLYSSLLALIYFLRTLSARRGMHYILQTMSLVNNSVRVRFFSLRR